MGLSGQLEKLKNSSEICYYCGEIPLCRYWNHKDSEITKIDENTSSVLIMFDTFAKEVELENAMNEFIKIIKETSNVIEIKASVLNEEKPNCEM